MNLHFCGRNETAIDLLSLTGDMQQKGNWLTDLRWLWGSH